MKSKVTKLYDYTQAEIPAELRLWRVSEEKIDRQLDLISHSHAQERDVEEVQTGDSVVCRGESTVGRWNKPVLLFYPGHGLCEKALEDDLVGMKVGESRTVAASEGDVTLTVIRVVRREAYPIGDELVRLEAIEGVETVADYRRWYREATEARNRQDRQAHIAVHLIREITEKSEYEIDEAEEYEWAKKVADIEYDAAVARGIDPTIPEEGTEFLTEEQARQKYVEMCRPLFRNVLAYPATAERLSGMSVEDFYRTELAREAEVYYHMPVEELLKQASEEDLRGQVFQNGTMYLLKDYGKQLLED